MVSRCMIRHTKNDDYYYKACKGSQGGDRKFVIEIIISENDDNEGWPLTSWEELQWKQSCSRWHVPFDRILKNQYYFTGPENISVSYIQIKIKINYTSWTKHVKGTTRVKFSNFHNLWKPHDNNVYIGYRQSKLYV